MFQQDIIKRLIEQIGQLIAAAMGRADEGRLTEADDDLKQAEAALGLPRGHEQLDGRSVLVLLRGSEKAELLAQIYEARARLRRMNHQTEEAAHLEAQAIELRRAAKSH